jgi:excisionase family DNA binding protein
VQEYLDLDEAAQQLGITAEELNRKAQRREIRAFADRGTWKFRKQDIDEHARQAGIGSGAEIVFGDLDDALPVLDTGSSDQILLPDMPADGSPGGSGARVIGMDQRGGTPSDSDVRLVVDAGKKKGSDSDVKLVGPKPPSDSDVKVVTTPGAGLSDSDVKIAGPAPGDSDVRLDQYKAPSDSGIRLSPDPEVGAAGSDVTQDLPVFREMQDEGLSIKSGSSGEQAVAKEPDSDFDLGLTQADSDFELGTASPPQGSDSGITLAMDDNIGLMPSDEEPSTPSKRDVTAHSPSSSGISLGNPADSGIALDEPPARPGGMPSKAKPASDVFETDFEVPVLDSDSALGTVTSDDTAKLTSDSDFDVSGSDFDLEGSDSSSHVLALEGEESADESAATSMAPAPQEEQWEEDLQGEEEPEFERKTSVMPAAQDEGLPAADSGPMAGPPLAPIAGPEAEWTGFDVGILTTSALLMVLLGMVMFDMVRTMWGWEDGQYLMYQSPILDWMKGLMPK